MSEILQPRQPRRIQRRRVKGWKAPKGAVYVGRPTKWGNPFPRVFRGDPTGAESVAAFERWLFGTDAGISLLRRARIELRGRDLMCWCKEGEACHADVLLRLANPEREST